MEGASQSVPVELELATMTHPDTPDQPQQDVIVIGTDTEDSEDDEVEDEEEDEEDDEQVQYVPLEAVKRALTLKNLAQTDANKADVLFCPC